MTIRILPTLALACDRASCDQHAAHQVVHQTDDGTQRLGRFCPACALDVARAARAYLRDHPTGRRPRPLGAAFTAAQAAFVLPKE